MKALTLAIALIAALTVAHAEGLRAQVEASTKAITAAMKKKDFAALTKQLKAGTTADFKYMEGGQTQTLDEMIQNMKAGLGSLDKITVCATKVITVKQKGKTAVGTIEHRMAGTMKGQDKKTHRMTFSGVAEDTYVMEGGKWKMSSMSWKSQKQTMDGKPVPGTGK